MLLLDDDDELPAPPEDDETTLNAQLGTDALRAIDTAIIGHARSHWCKVARVVHEAIETGNLLVGDAIVIDPIRRFDGGDHVSTGSRLDEFAPNGRSSSLRMRAR
jgi:hypothetical protein